MRSAPLVLILFLSVQACAETECPEGTIAVGTQCRATRRSAKDSGTLGNDVEASRDAPPDSGLTCGNGVLDSERGETCDLSSSVACPSSCDDGDACTDDELLGSSASCDARCLHTRRAPDLNRTDGCCGPGATSKSDVDCASECGNGRVDEGELCDGDCSQQADCEDGDPCTIDTLVGSGCTTSCSRELSIEGDVDGCCMGAETWFNEPACPKAYGCGADCPLADDPSTSGDDRAGYVSCGALACGPGSACSLTDEGGLKCDASYVGKNLAVCDGIEDCPAGMYCYPSLPQFTDQLAFCAKADANQSGEYSACHEDADCGSSTLVCAAGSALYSLWPARRCKPTGS